MKKTTVKWLEWLGDLFREAIRGAAVDLIKDNIGAIVGGCFAAILVLPQTHQVEDNTTRWRLVHYSEQKITVGAQAVGPLAPLDLL